MSCSSCHSNPCCCPPGPRGPMGLPGTNGSTGYTGYTGFTGPIGPTGPVQATDRWIYAGQFTFQQWIDNPHGGPSQESLLPVGTIPAGYVLTDTAIKQITQFDGEPGTPGMTPTLVFVTSSGPGSNAFEYNNIEQSTRNSKTITGPVTSTHRQDVSVPYPISLDLLTSGGGGIGNIDDLTEGVLQAWYRIEQLP